MHLDASRPDGVHGRLQIDAAGRDLLTLTGGSTEELHALRVEMQADPDLLVRRLQASPADHRLRDLEGSSVGRGFRARIARTLGEPSDADSLLLALLDDLPITAMISNYARRRAGFVPVMPATSHPKADVCAGWISGGSMMQRIELTRRVPLPVGPPAPEIDPSSDPTAWHHLPRAPLNSLRRRRRIDVWSAAGGLQVDAMFRDEHVDNTGTRTVLHEYGILMRADITTRIVTETQAQPRVLPWPECTDAAASAEQLVGMDLESLRTSVARELVGTSTCTHLSDALRALEGVTSLAARLPADAR